MESSNDMKDVGVGEDSVTVVGGESHVGEDTIAKSEKSTIDDQQTANESVDLLRGWDNTPDDITPPNSPGIDYSTLDEDETPYEHNFEPGDHVIRWDMLVCNIMFVILIIMCYVYMVYYTIALHSLLILILVVSFCSPFFGLSKFMELYSKLVKIRVR